MSLDDKISLMAMFSGGTPIEFRNKYRTYPEWEDVDIHHEFNFEHYEYRIKAAPEKPLEIIPMEIDVYISASGRIFNWADAKPHKKALEAGGFMLKKFREVL